MLQASSKSGVHARLGAYARGMSAGGHADGGREHVGQTIDVSGDRIVRIGQAAGDLGPRLVKQRSGAEARVEESVRSADVDRRGPAERVKRVERGPLASGHPLDRMATKILEHDCVEAEKATLQSRVQEAQPMSVREARDWLEIARVVRDLAEMQATIDCA